MRLAEESSTSAFSQGDGVLINQAGNIEQIAKPDFEKSLTLAKSRQHSTSLLFDEPVYVSSPVAQSGPIAYTLAGAGHRDGVVIRDRVQSDGVNPISFPSDFEVYGMGGATSAVLPAGTYSIWMVYLGGLVEVNIPGVDTGGTTPVPNSAPVITLAGANPMTLTVGDTYTEPGAAASDAEDGDISGSIVITGAVDTATAGTYTRYYNVSDSQGLAATEVTRTVQVNAPGNVTPAAPTNGIVDDTANTFTVTIPEQV